MPSFACLPVSFPLRDITRARRHFRWASHRPASLRPQAFSTSRRFFPLSSLQAYFIPQPRPGSVSSRGLLSPRSHPSSSEGVAPVSLPHRPLTFMTQLAPIHARVHVRCLSTSRPLSAQGRVSRVRLFTSPETAPLFEFRSSRFSLLPTSAPITRRLPLMMFTHAVFRPGAHC
jgi:hypothetical protein